MYIMYLFLCVCILRANCLFLLPFKRSLLIIEQSVKQVSLCELAPLSPFWYLRLQQLKLSKRGGACMAIANLVADIVNTMFTLHLLNGT